MRERFDQQKSVKFTRTMYGKIEKAANQFGVSFGEIIRECVDKELDKLIDREKKRKRSQRNP